MASDEPSNNCWAFSFVKRWLSARIRAERLTAKALLAFEAVATSKVDPADNAMALLINTRRIAAESGDGRESGVLVGREVRLANTGTVFHSLALMR